MTDYTSFLPAIGADTDFYDKYSDLLDALNTDIDSVTDYTDFLPAPYVDTDFAVKFAGLLQALDNDLPSPTISYISKLPAIGADKDFAINYSAILTALNEENFIVAPSDPEWANVSLLIYGEDDITDETGKTITINDNTALSSSQAKFGTNSIYLDGDGDCITLPNSSDFSFGAGDFTIELWVYIIKTGVNVLFDMGFQGSSGAYLFESSTTLVYRRNNTNRITASGACPSNQWNHIALSRESTDTKLFVNGIEVGSWVDAGSHTVSPTYLPVFGANYNHLYELQGYMEQIRITKGVARYTSNFTPPTEPFPNS